MGHHVIEYDCQCKDCQGTGVYKGLGERDVFGVVCYHCDGTGKRHEKIEYDDFEGRKRIPGVTQMLECNPGIVAGINPEEGLTIESFGGMPYEDWFKGNPFPAKSEMRQFTCPAWWYQNTNYDLKPDWCHEYGFHFGSFSTCPRFPNKELCWQRFDEEQAKKA